MNRRALLSALIAAPLAAALPASRPRASALRPGRYVVRARTADLIVCYERAPTWLDAANDDFARAA